MTTFFRSFLIILIMILDTSCRTKVVTLPVEHIEIKTDTIYKERRIVERDTLREVSMLNVLIRDSVSPNVDSTGRVTGYDRWHWESRDGMQSIENARLRVENDSLRRVTGRSEIKEVPVPVEVEKIREVPAELSWWQKTQMWIGRIVLLMGIVAGALVLIKRHTGFD